jgi:arsenite-transporting ATPase
VDTVIANRLVPAFEDSGAAGQWLATRRAEQLVVLDELTNGTDLTVRTVPHQANEPIGAQALLVLAAELYGEGDPLAGTDARRAPLLSVTGGGRDLDSAFQLRISVPLTADADIDLARVDDELALTIDGRRRLIGLPAALRRCSVTGADVDEQGVLVHFRPDPAVWMR